MVCEGSMSVSAVCVCNFYSGSEITASGGIKRVPVQIIYPLITGTIIADFCVRNVLCTLKGYYVPLIYQLQHFSLLHTADRTKNIYDSTFKTFNRIQPISYKINLFNGIPKYLKFSY